MAQGPSQMQGGVLQTLAGQAGNEGGSAPLVRQYLSAMTVLDLDNDPRCRMLAMCQSFYNGGQHDHHGSDWAGYPRDPGVGYMQERLKPQGFVPVNSTPHAYRKPDAPVPLARQVVSRFTEMLTGEGRRAHLRCWSSVETQDYLDAAFKSANLWDVLSQARDVAGACRSSLIALGLVGGYFEAEVLHPKHCWVAEWDAEQPGWVPKVVIEQTRVERQVWVQDDTGAGLPPQDQSQAGKGRLETKVFWQTRAWTEDEVIYYVDVPVDDVPEDGIEVRETKKHKFGACPVVWYQNTRDTSSPDGMADCEGAWPLLDKLDRLQSQVYKAAIANTDPTLVVKQTRQARRRNSVIRKGSDGGALSLDTDGDAKYLEMQGTSVEVGMKAIERLVYQVLQTVECVVIHPDTAKAYQSGEALQILWRSMESRANRLRVTLGCAIRDLAKLLLSAAKAHKVADVEKADGVDYKGGILLPPRRVIEVEEPEPQVAPTEAGEPPPMLEPVKPEETFEPHKPGSPSTYVDLEWPPYWTPTAAQIAAMAQAMTTATTQKQVLSTETAARSLSQMMGSDGDEEIRRIALEKREGMAQMLAGIGGMPPDIDDDDDDDEGMPEATDDDESGPLPIEGKDKTEPKEDEQGAA